jgi:hypothetical protein
MWLITAIIKEYESAKLAESNIIVDAQSIKMAKLKVGMFFADLNIECINYISGKLSEEELHIINENELNLIRL